LPLGEAKQVKKTAQGLTKKLSKLRSGLGRWDSNGRKEERDGEYEFGITGIMMLYSYDH